MVPSDRIPADRVEAAAKALWEADAFPFKWDEAGNYEALYRADAEAALVASGYEVDLAARDQRIKELEAERDFLREREAHFAKVLGVPDGGQYRNDWDSRLTDALKSVARVRVLEAENERLSGALERVRDDDSLRDEHGLMLEGAVCVVIDAALIREGDLIGSHSRDEVYEDGEPTGEPSYGYRLFSGGGWEAWHGLLTERGREADDDAARVAAEAWVARGGQL